MAIVYHGTYKQNQKVIKAYKPLSAHDKSLKDTPTIYASPDPAVSSCFMFQWSDDEGYNLGSKNNGPLTFSIPSRFKDKLNQPGSLYVLDAKYFTTVEGGFGQEAISHQDVPVIREIKYNRVIDALKEHGIKVKIISFEVKEPSNLVDVTKYKFKVDLSEIEYFKYKDKRIRLKREAAEALVEARKLLPHGFNFVISSGYRTYQQQITINEYMKEKLKKQYPNNWEEMLDKFTGGEDYLKYLRTHKGEYSYMSHASGLAVDVVGIVDDTGNAIDLGGQTNTLKDNIDYYENKSDVINENRQLLKHALSNSGFYNYESEWWHWALRRN